MSLADHNQIEEFLKLHWIVRAQFSSSKAKTCPESRWSDIKSAI